jgi:glycosyltransferase involved in cell wall biosynthesis
VLYVETTGLRGAGRGDLTRLLRRLRRGIAGRYRAESNVWVFSPLAVPLSGPDAVRKLNRMILRDSILGQVRDLGLLKPLLLTSLPTAASLDLVGHLGEVASVYDCMDDLTAVPLVDPSIGRTEAELVNRVDVVVTASEELRRLKAGLGPHMVVIGQGVDPAHFAGPTICPPELSRLPRPLLLFVGGVDDRLDFELVEAVARRRPDWSILLLGPELYVRAAQHLDSPNVHRLGRRSFGDLPAYVQAADVCLVPYRDTAWARACNPVKVLEYLAAGRPVVSTDVPAVRAYEPFVRIACDPDSFVAAVEAALHEDDPGHQEARRARARGDTWATRADALFDLGSAVARERSPDEQPR